MLSPNDEVLCYLRAQESTGLIWDVTVGWVYRETELGDDSAVDTKVFRYTTHAKTHYNVLLSELNEIARIRHIGTEIEVTQTEEMEAKGRVAVAVVTTPEEN